MWGAVHAPSSRVLGGLQTHACEPALLVQEKPTAHGACRHSSTSGCEHGRAGGHLHRHGCRHSSCSQHGTTHRRRCLRRSTHRRRTRCRSLEEVSAAPAQRACLRSRRREGEEEKTGIRHTETKVAAGGVGAVEAHGAWRGLALVDVCHYSQQTQDPRCNKTKPILQQQTHTNPPVSPVQPATSMANPSAHAVQFAGPGPLQPSVREQARSQSRHVWLPGVLMQCSPTTHGLSVEHSSMSTQPSRCS